MKKILFAGLIVLVIVAGWFIHLLYTTGQFKTIVPHFAGECRPVTGVIGAEDITIHPKTGIAYISASDRRALIAGRPGLGAIYAYRLDTPDATPIDLTTGLGVALQPHGISLLLDPEGLDRLFVINHANGVHTVEVFSLSGTALRHEQTLSDPLLVSPNDIVAVGPNRFYATNDHGWPKGFFKVLEDYLMIPLATVVYYDGSGFSEAAGGIRYANGVNVSKDGATLFVGSSTGNALMRYDRDVATGRLQLQETIDLNTGVDNIERDSHGGLWIGAHPQLLKFVAHAGDAAKHSPSQVLHLSAAASGGFTVDEIYLNAGEALSGASVAAVSGNRMLIGSVFEPAFLDCQMADSVVSPK